VNDAISTWQKKKNENLSESNLHYYNLLIKHISSIPNIENFTYIGNKIISNDDTQLSFEIHCRYNKEEELEILFNDVSKTKIEEKQNAEFKYKTLFLSKVAHEFKNPLICIAELINQSLESLPKDTEIIEIRKNLDQARSLSNFLQILIKDLNYFSEGNCGKISEHSLNETNILEVMSFCQSITNSLLQKSNKQDTVKLKINIDKNVPKKILTDEWRLKQILINLLSNSVKFTLFGEIQLFLYLENLDNVKYVKFLISDTGVGIKPDNFCRLFKPFNKDLNSNSKYNEFGSGLGLSLCKEISEKLGPGLKFDSKEGEGSSFWFHIPLLLNTNTPEVDLHMTEKCDEVSILLIDDNSHLSKFENDNNNNNSSDDNLCKYSINGSNTAKTIVYDKPFLRPNIWNYIININEFNLNCLNENNLSVDNLMSIRSNGSSVK
jgi:signal transduction histidine kinase